MVGEICSIGLLGAFEIFCDKESRTRFGESEGLSGAIFRDQCIGNGPMVRAACDMFVMCSPLISSLELIDEMIAIMEKTLDEVTEKLHDL